MHYSTSKRTFDEFLMWGAGHVPQTLGHHPEYGAVDLTRLLPHEEWLVPCIKKGKKITEIVEA